jgi:hypothetical protein
MFTPASSKSERTHFRSSLVFPAKSRITDLIGLHERHQQMVIEGDDEAHYTTDGYSVDITSLISRVESSVSLLLPQAVIMAEASPFAGRAAVRLLCV